MMNTMHKTAWLACLALGLSAGAAHAATAVCAGNAATLQNDLTGLAANSLTPLTIRIGQGTYALGRIRMDALAPITIEGGYQPGSNCTQRAVDPANTVLDFGGAFVDLWQREGAPAAGLVLEGLTLQHGRQLYLWVGDSEDDVVGNLTLRRVRIRDFVGDTAYDYTTPIAAM